MIRNENEYREAVKRIDAEKRRLDEHVDAWRNKGFSRDEIARLREPLECFQQQLVEEVQSYERLMRGQFDEFENLQGLGQILIGLRIAKGMTQRELAKLLGVNESAVSRDERNEYHGITIERAMRILDALDVRLLTRIESAKVSAKTSSRPHRVRSDSKKVITKKAIGAFRSPAKTESKRRS